MSIIILEPTPEVIGKFKQVVNALPQKVFDNIDRALEKAYGDKVNDNTDSKKSYNDII